ncbi:hypothetical protein ACWV95_26230 [Streptomyces albus]
MSQLPEGAPAPAARAAGRPQWRGIIEEYRDRLPVAPDTAPVTLREGVRRWCPPRCSPS